MVIKLIGSERAVEIVSNAALEKNIGRFVVMHSHDNYYTAVDNLAGKSISKRFETIPECITWLYQQKKIFLFQIKNTEENYSPDLMILKLQKK